MRIDKNLLERIKQRMAHTNPSPRQKKYASSSGVAFKIFNAIAKHIARGLLLLRTQSILSNNWQRHSQMRGSVITNTNACVATAKTLASDVERLEDSASE
eukprot:2837020-Pleurochrysis_carterae.AAC.1